MFWKKVKIYLMVTVTVSCSCTSCAISCGPTFRGGKSGDDDAWKVFSGVRAGSWSSSNTVLKPHPGSRCTPELAAASSHTRRRLARPSPWRLVLLTPSAPCP